MRRDDGKVENMFASRWGVIKTIAKQIERMDKKNSDPTWQLRRESLSELTEQILTSYETGASNSRSVWVNQLARESLSYLQGRSAQQRTLNQQIDLQTATEQLVQTAYGMLKTYAFEFNNAVGLSELHVTSIKPCLVTEVLRYSINREPIETLANFRTRFSTRSFSLVVRGNQGKVEFLCLPVHKVIGMSKTEVAYPPLARLMGSIDEGKVLWMIGDEELTLDKFESLLKDLFKMLIEKTRQLSN